MKCLGLGAEIPEEPLAGGRGLMPARFPVSDAVALRVLREFWSRPAPQQRCCSRATPWTTTGLSTCSSACSTRRSKLLHQLIFQIPPSRQALLIERCSPGGVVGDADQSDHVSILQADEEAWGRGLTCREKVESRRPNPGPASSPLLFLWKVSRESSPTPHRYYAFDEAFRAGGGQKAVQGHQERPG